MIGVVAFAITMVLMVFFQKPAETAAANGEHGQGTNAVSNGTNAVAEGAPATGTNAPMEHAAPEEAPKPSGTPSIPTSAFTGVVGEPGTHSFNNPDIKALWQELQREKGALLLKENQLKELARQVALEKAEIASSTQWVLNAKAAIMSDLTNQMTIRDKGEEARLKDLAKVYTNMPPSSAVQILNGMEVEDIARIMFFMDHVSQAGILENFATNKETSASLKATEISQKIRKLGDKPKLTGTK